MTTFFVIIFGINLLNNKKKRYQFLKILQLCSHQPISASKAGKMKYVPGLERRQRLRYLRQHKGTVSSLLIHLQRSVMLCIYQVDTLVYITLGNNQLVR